MTQQILITGTPRSGTSLLAQIIMAHPQVNGTYDAVNFMRFCHEKYGKEGNIKLLPLLKDLYERIYLRWGLEFDIKEVQENLRDTCGYKNIYDEIMKDLFIKDNKETIWCEKTTNVWFESLSFLEMFPQGKVLHITRNPLDVLASWKKFTHAPGNDYLDIIFNCLASNRHAKLFNSHCRNYMHVEYEDLVNNTEEIVKKIVNFLEISYFPSMIDSKNYQDKQGEKWTGNSMFSKNISGIQSNNKDKRRDSLEDWEQDLVKTVFGSGIVTARSKRKILDELTKSKLAIDGFLRYLMLDMGVQRFPLDPLKSENWESEKKQLMKWKED